MFAAYASKVDKDESSSEIEAKKNVKGNDWLTNSSFTINTEGISNNEDLSGCSKKNCVVKCERSHERSHSDTDSESHGGLSAPQTPQATPSSIDSETDSHGRCTPLNSPSDSESSSEELSQTRNRISSTNKSLERKHSPSQNILSSNGPNHKGPRSPKSSKSDAREKRKSRSPSSLLSNISDRRQFERKRDSSTDRGKSRSRRKRRSRSRRRSRSGSSRRRHKHRSLSRDSKRISKREKDSKRRRNSSSSSSRCGSPSRRNKTSDARDQIFYEDKTRSYGNLSVITLSRPAVAWYRTSRKGLGLPKLIRTHSIKHTLKKRYYNVILKKMEADLTSLKEKERNDDQKVGQIQGNVNDVEEEISKITAKFNQDLGADPKNVDTWKKYVQFQDTVHQFERMYRRGGGATGARVTSERKLAILDKALKENPMCEELLKERCQLAESVLPSDKLTSQLKTWIGTDPGNLVLWEALIMASQGSLSRCKVPAVKSLYQQALKNIHSLNRGNTEPPKTIEAKLIDLVLHLGLFLRQAGLQELMWSLISVYLEFNLAKLDPTKFHISNTVADNALIELEEAILGSQLPLSTLWLRVETLRTGTHWVPLPADADSEDPQRLVFPEDINDLIHPINSPHLAFRLVTVTLTLLKVPLLPWRESAAKAAGLHPLPWLLDGPEPLYASLLPLGTLEFKGTSSLLLDASQLTSGPQYLIARPGQDEYIDFLTQVFSACSDCLPSTQKTYLLVWWLRFYRWLMQMERLGHCKLPQGRKKKMRSAAKDLLRKDANRSNYLLFKEFALLELENGGSDAAKKVLQGTISALPSKPIPLDKDRASICSLYRTLVEVHLSDISIGSESTAESSKQFDDESEANDRTMALCLLVSLGRGCPLKLDKPSNTDMAAAISKFHHITRVTLDNPSEEELDPFIAPDVCHLAPTFLVEWAACHGWLLFLSNSIWKAATMFENVLSELVVAPSSSSESPENTSSCAHDNFVRLQREALLEVYISLMRHHCFVTRGSYAVLREVLTRGLTEFPGNLTFSAALADLETNSSGTGLPLWRLSKIFHELNSAPAYALFAFVMRYRMKQQESAAQRARSLVGEGGPELPDPNVRNRMSTLLKKLTNHPTMRRCPMLWRLRLQFAAAVSTNDAECSSTFYLALENCPWAKALYMDIVQVLPTQLAQVQDLLVEKELRLHVTPEELQILRVDS